MRQFSAEEIDFLRVGPEPTPAPIICASELVRVDTERGHTTADPRSLAAFACKAVDVCGGSAALCVRRRPQMHTSLQTS